MRGPSVRFFLFAALAFAVCGAPALADEARIRTEGRVNGRPARLVLDTGVSFPLAMQHRSMAKYALSLDADRHLDPAAAVVLDGFSRTARIELPPGKHTLQLALGDAKHYPFDPPVVSKKITITVK